MRQMLLSTSTTTSNVVHLDPDKRLRALVLNWKGIPTNELLTRCQALSMHVARGGRLPPDVYQAWLCMSAVAVVSRAMGRD